MRSTAPMVIAVVDAELVLVARIDQARGRVEPDLDLGPVDRIGQGRQRPQQIQQMFSTFYLDRGLLHFLDLHALKRTRIDLLDLLSFTDRPSARAPRPRWSQPTSSWSPWEMYLRDQPHAESGPEVVFTRTWKPRRLRFSRMYPPALRRRPNSFEATGLCPVVSHHLRYIPYR